MAKTFKTFENYSFHISYFLLVCLRVFLITKNRLAQLEIDIDFPRKSLLQIQIPL